MRLDYTVLCIDDIISSLRNTKRELTRHNIAVGVHTEFLDVPVVQDTFEKLDDMKIRVFQEISDKFDNHQIDLVIVDLHLGNMEGHEVIERIRASQTIYRPIIFYSGGDPAGEVEAKKQLHDGLINNDLVGKSVFLSVRGRDLERDLKRLCSEMHNEEHKLNASRGLLMDQTSEIDAKILEYLKGENAWLGLTGKQVENLHKDLKSELARQEKNAGEKSKSMGLLKEKSLDEIVSWAKDARPTELDAMGWNKILRALLKARTETLDRAEVHKGYFNDTGGSPSVSKLRNQYAHQTAEQIGEGHDFDRCKFIRDELRKHLENIDHITKASS